MNTETAQLLDYFLNLFVNRDDVYDVQGSVWSRKKQCSQFAYIPVWEPPTRKVLLDHLTGKITVGLPALSKDGLGKWLLFDSDKNNGQMDKLDSFLCQHRWHTLREGKRFDSEKQIFKDGHLWLLFDAPIPGSQLRILGQAMLKQSGAVIDEIYPKQDKPKKIGSLVKLPLGIHRKKGANNCRSLFEACPEKTVKGQLKWLAQQPLNNAEMAIKLAHAHRPMPKPIYLKRQTHSPGYIDFVDYAYDQGFDTDGDYMRGLCPACADEGRDTDGNHMWVNVKTGAAGCWCCEFIDIAKAIKGTRNSVA